MYEKHSADARRSDELLACEADSMFVGCPGPALPAWRLHAAGLPALPALLAAAADAHTLLAGSGATPGETPAPPASARAASGGRRGSMEGPGWEAVQGSGFGDQPAGPPGDQEGEDPQDDLAIRGTDTLMERAGKRWRRWDRWQRRGAGLRCRPA